MFIGTCTHVILSQRMSFFFVFHIISIFSEGFRVLTAARLLRESKAGQWKNALVAKARGFLEIVVRFSSEFFSFCTFYVC